MSPSVRKNLTPPPPRNSASRISVSPTRNSPPRVSIVTPTYNRLHTLPRCWESIKSQTLTDFQWIVIDDGSADGTGDWIKGLGDKRIVYHWQKNQGMNAAKNLGRKYIKADYVTYLDSDDTFYSKTSLAEMLDAIKHSPPPRKPDDTNDTDNDIGIVNFPVVDEAGKRSYDNLKQDRVVVDYVGRVCDKPASGEFIYILRREIDALVPWPPYRRVASLRHLALARHTKTLFVNKPMQVYYIDTKNKAADNNTAIGGFLRTLDDMALGTRDVIAQHKATLIAHCPPRYSRYCSSLALYYLMQGKTLPAIPCLATALRYGNFRLRVKALILAALVPIPAFVRRKLFVFAWHFR